MISDKEYKKLLKQFHKLSDRHILVVETDMPASDVQKVVILSDKIRKAGNELVGLMRKNYDQLMRTKKYRKLLKLYGSTKDKKKHRDLANQLNEMQKQYNVTWDHCRNAMIHIGNIVLMPYLPLQKLKIYGVVLKNVFITMVKLFIFLNMVSCLVSGQNR